MYSFSPSIREAMMDVATQIKTILDDCGNSIFVDVAIWNQQIKRLIDGSGYPFNYPSAFIEVIESDHELYGLGYTAFDIDFIIHIFHEQLDAGDGTLDQNLKVFNLRNLIKENLMMFKPRQCGNIFWIGEEQDYDHDNSYHYKETFKGRMVDPIGNQTPVCGTYSQIDLIFDWYSMNFGAMGSTFSVIIGATAS